MSLVSSYTPKGVLNEEHLSFAFRHKDARDQEDYIASAIVAIEHLTHILISYKDHAELKEVFYECIQYASEQRRNIALKISDGSELVYFGLPRVSIPEASCCIDLENSYKSYGDFTSYTMRKELETSEVLQEILADALVTTHSFIRANPIEPIKENDPLKLQTQIQFLSNAFCEGYSDFFIVDHLNTELEEIAQRPLDILDPIKIEHGTRILNEIKQKDENRYNLERLMRCISNYQSELNDENKLYIVKTLSYNSNSKIIPLTQYIMCINLSEDETKDSALEKIEHASSIRLLHQDPLDIFLTLEDAFHFFALAIQWSRDQEVDLLKQFIGLMMYLLAHNHRDARGSAAASEWLERALYRTHGFSLIDAYPNRMPDLIAFCHMDTDLFLTEYKNSFLLKQI